MKEFWCLIVRLGIVGGGEKAAGHVADLSGREEEPLLVWRLLGWLEGRPAQSQKGGLADRIRSTERPCEGHCLARNRSYRQNQEHSGKFRGPFQPTYPRRATSIFPVSGPSPDVGRLPFARAARRPEGASSTGSRTTALRGLMTLRRPSVNLAMLGGARRLAATHRALWENRAQRD